MKRTSSWLLAALLLGAALPNLAQAADITVDETDCTLADAINTANDGNAYGTCAIGSATEADTITLETNVTLAAALPQISSTITIEGGGHFISGDNRSGAVLQVISGGNLTLNETIVTDGYSVGAGGGIYNYAGTVILTNSTVSGNKAKNGGGIYNSVGIVTLINSIVSGNKSDYTSGGIENKDILILINSSISGNRAPYGGGIRNNSGEVTLTNCTVSGNSSSAGGGIYNSGTVTLHSSIISGNTAANNGRNEIYNSGTVTADSYNVLGSSEETNVQAFSGFTPSGSDINATSDGGGTPTALDAILSTTLTDNGGPTLTHALVAGSPAIDLDTSCNSGTITEDQRGKPRPVGNGCDAGAFEYGDFTVTPSAGAGGSVTPDTAQAIAEGGTASFTVTPDAGYTKDAKVSGTCPEGSWEGNTYTTGQIDADCTVEFSFKKINMVPVYKLLLLK